MADHMATLQAAADRIKSEQRAMEGKRLSRIACVNLFFIKQLTFVLVRLKSAGNEAEHSVYLRVTRCGVSIELFTR